MQTSKILLAVGASLVISLSVRGDTDAQAKARQALEQQLNQPPPQPAAPVPPPPTPAPAKKIPPPPEMAPATAPAVAAPAPETHADDQSIAKAREAMHQKINELATPPAAAAPAPPQPPPAEPPPKVIPPPSGETGSSDTTGSDTGASPQAIEKARAAMRQKVAELPNEPAEPGSANEAARAKALAAMYDKMQQLPPYAGSAEVGSMQFPPLEGPELPISGAKVQRLHALLQQYKADQITPEQYQSARAKILAEP